MRSLLVLSPFAASVQYNRAIRDGLQTVRSRITVTVGRIGKRSEQLFQDLSIVTGRVDDNGVVAVPAVRYDRREAAALF